MPGHQFETFSQPRRTVAWSGLIWLLPAVGFALLYLSDRYLESTASPDAAEWSVPYPAPRTAIQPAGDVPAPLPVPVEAEQKPAEVPQDRPSATATVPRADYTARRVTGTEGAFLPDWPAITPQPGIRLPIIIQPLSGTPGEPSRRASVLPPLPNLPPLPEAETRDRDLDLPAVESVPPPVAKESRQPPHPEREGGSPDAAYPIQPLISDSLRSPRLPVEATPGVPVAGDVESEAFALRDQPYVSAVTRSSGQAIDPHGDISTGRQATRGTRSSEQAAIDRRADEHVRTAFVLAERGALYSARTELILALRLVSQALDREEQSTRHADALARGLRALQESEDFIPRGTQLESDLDVRALIGSHRTPVLKEQAARQRPATPLTPAVAVQQYLHYAQQQLVAACGARPSGSLALYGLGRLHAVPAGNSADAGRRNYPQAMTLYQAAVLTDPNNYMAANELGVMLARYGRLEAAKEVLQLAVRSSPQPETWRNLVVVHRELGEHSLAEQADRQWRSARQGSPVPVHQASNPGHPQSAVEWVPPQAFSAGQPARGSGPPDSAPAAPRDNPTPTAATPPPAEQRTGLLTEWLNRLR